MPPMAANERTIVYLSHAPEAMYAMLRAHLAPGLRLVTLAEDDDAERFAALPHADAVLVGAHRLRRDYIEAAPKLSLVQHQGVGWHDTVDHDTLKQRGVRLAINPLMTAETVAEHALLLMLASLRHLARADAATRRGEWLVNALRPLCRNLRGATVGIVGMGRIGSSLAALLQPFRVRGLYCDPYVRLPEGLETALGFTRVDLPALLAESDVVSLHVPATAETRNMIRAATLAQMKPGAFLVNTCRGPVVHTDDLVAALRSGRLAGAGLDVFEPEPLPVGHPLYELPNVTLSPHTAAGTRDTMEIKMREAMENIARFFNGGALLHEVALD
jgi:phosphoglycerate dehydrogenase-like enzyme